MDLFEQDPTTARPPPVHPRLHVGRSGWAYPDWVGPFSPAGTLPRDFLASYSQRFGAVEFDSTFYRIPTAKIVDAWKAATPEDFRFAPKVPRVITHERRLQDCAGELAMFLDVMRRLMSKLGPPVLQFDAEVRVESLPVLAAFLEGVPNDIRYAVEIRHPGWLCGEFSQLLEKHKVALVLADQYYMPKPDKVTTNFTSIRLLGKRSDIRDDFSRVRLDREGELKLWSERIRTYFQRRLEVFVCANNRFQGHGPATARTLLTRLSGTLPTS